MFIFENHIQTTDKIHYVFWDSADRQVVVSFKVNKHKVENIAFHVPVNPGYR